MNEQHIELYQRIQEFSLDDRTSDFTFTQRLARENRWTLQYAERSIVEYKKFAFLAVAAGHPVTPSEEVDRVWHLHLLYTQSYWGEFCPHILQTPLHHSPTRGGKQEYHKFHDWYDRTLASYEAFFGYPPPADIWPAAAVRFDRNACFQYLNTRQYWLLPKPSREIVPQFSGNRSMVAVVLLGIALTLTGCEVLGLATFPNPLDFRGSQFLTLYITLVSAALIFQWGSFEYFKRSDIENLEETVSLDTYETAYLAGGNDRVVETAIATLVQRGHLKPDRKTRTLEVVNPLPDNSHPLEAAIESELQARSKFDRFRLKTAAGVVAFTDDIRNRLINLKLLPKLKDSRQLQWLFALPVLLVWLLGLTKLGVGMSRGKPVGFLLLLCVATAFIGWQLLKRSWHRTEYGEWVLTRLQMRHSDLKKQLLDDLGEQAGLAFALFGMSVLTSGELQGLRQVLASFWSPYYSDRLYGD
ncbi:TIGR04222 domain-containing membrane protein, partial [Oscillatoriales cyanobacterium LEGE 11467]